MHALKLRKTYLTPDTAVGQQLVVWAQTRICDGPLTAIVMRGLVVLPIIRITCIVHPHLEVLTASEEERAIFGKLARVTSSVQVDNEIGFASRYQSLRC